MLHWTLNPFLDKPKVASLLPSTLRARQARCVGRQYHLGMWPASGWLLARPWQRVHMQTNWERDLRCSRQYPIRSLKRLVPNYEGGKPKARRGFSSCKLVQQALPTIKFCVMSDSLLNLISSIRPYSNKYLHQGIGIALVRLRRHSMWPTLTAAMSEHYCQRTSLSSSTMHTSHQMGNTSHSRRSRRMGTRIFIA